MPRVRGFDCRRDLMRDEHCARGEQRAERDLVGEHGTLEVLEHDVRNVRLRESHVRRLDDVGMAERAGRERLVHEPADHHRIARELLVQDLDRDLALDQPMLREEHRAHAAFGDRSNDLVAALDYFADFDYLLGQTVADCTGDRLTMGIWPPFAGEPRLPRRLSSP